MCVCGYMYMSCLYELNLRGELCRNKGWMRYKHIYGLKSRSQGTCDFELGNNIENFKIKGCGFPTNVNLAYGLKSVHFMNWRNIAVRYLIYKSQFSFFFSLIQNLRWQFYILMKYNGMNLSA